MILAAKIVSQAKPTLFFYGQQTWISFQSNTSPNTFNNHRCEDWRFPLLAQPGFLQHFCQNNSLSQRHRHPFIAYSWLKTCPWCRQLALCGAMVFVPAVPKRWEGHHGHLLTTMLIRVCHPGSQGTTQWFGFKAAQKIIYLQPHCHRQGHLPSSWRPGFSNPHPTQPRKSQNTN